MVQTAEAQAFLARIASLPKDPGVNLDEVLQPSLDDETELRRFLATDRSNARLINPYVGLVDVFEAPSDIKITRARVIKDDQDLNAKYVMPLAEDRRRKEGEPCMVGDLDEFKRNWNIFTEGSLSQLTEWSNVIVAGGSVVASLAPLSDVDKASKRAIRKQYHSAVYSTSDIDLFLWGLTPEQAEKKIITIYEAVRDSIPWDLTCVRTKNTISIHSQYPYRSIQIVLRLYHSPAEVLAGFDIDAPCCAYDGTHVWANPRAVVAMMRQCNTIDLTRRSPSYEVRLLKYYKRGFEIYVPSLVRADIDPTIFERSIVRMEGLARLLVLERLATFDERQSFLLVRRELRGRPPPAAPALGNKKQKRKYPHDLKSSSDLEELEMNDYDVPFLHIPYGPGWKARKTENLIYKTDLGMNTTFNPKNRGRRLHRHSAFFGTIEECIEDCCECCPEPIDEAERELQSQEDKIFIRGRIAFIQDNPGRQIITGSFKPIDVGDWSAQVYIGPTERIFAAIAARDRTAVANMIKKGVDVNRRDHVGRSPLHFAIMCNATEITYDLVDAGARMTARLVDGRTSLHLAVQRDQAAVVRKLLESSVQNRETKGTETEGECNENLEKDDRDRPSSEDDWSSEDDGVLEFDDEEGTDDEDGINADKKAVEDEGNGEGKPSRGDEEAEQGDEIPEDTTDQPDVLDLNATDWDFGLTPLAYAVIFASLPIIEDLIEAGVDIQASTRNNKLMAHPLALTILRPDEDEACKVAERLIIAGATSSPADSQFRTIFYRIVASKKVKLASTILRCDPNANAVINFPCIDQSGITFPLVLAIHNSDYSMVATLLAYGARLQPLEEDITRAISTRPATETLHLFYHRRNSNLLTQVYLPVETALNRHDDIVRLLITLGADVNVGIQTSYGHSTREEERRSVFDWVNMAIAAMETQIKGRHKAKEGPNPEEFSLSTNWKEYATRAVTIANFLPWSYRNMNHGQMHDIERIERTKQYFEDIRELLISIGAKTWAELKDADILKSRSDGMVLFERNIDELDSIAFKDYGFSDLAKSYRRFPNHLVQRYHELCDACLRGDNAKIQALCLPLEGGQSDGIPLQITAMLRARYDTGVTPFSIAVKSRKWDTARLILAIAAAQYEADEEDVVKNIDLDDGESVNGTDDSDDSEITVEQITEDKFYVDVAKRPSTIKCDIKPGLFLTSTCGYFGISNGRYYKETVFEKAIRENDLEAFVKLLDMLINLPIPENIPRHLISSLLNRDQSDILNELIRRTGTGIDLKIIRQEEKEAAPVNDRNKIYLGLNIHGKKRIDLARKNDPNAGLETKEPPLLWRALRVNAKNTIDYLTGEKVYDAYRSYAISHSGERAELLRKFDNLKELLPQWLGIRTNSFGESPLTAAVLSGKAELVKNLFSKHKNMMKAALHNKYKPANLNILHIAIRAGKDMDTELLDFLLAKNISPLDTDVAGRNPYHLLCQQNSCRILKHLLEKLPLDVNETLIKQQTRGQLKTPLHFAVEAGAVNAVEMLLACSHVANAIRDSDGCLPIHIAVRRGFSRIAKLLISTSPSTLLTEDGVGSTAFESASLNSFRQRMDHFNNGNYISRVTSSELNTADKDPERYDLGHLEKELPRLRDTINSLLSVGKLRKDTKLEKELVAFAERMEDQMRRLQQAPVVVEPEEENPTDVQDYNATCDVVREALNDVQDLRKLVHVMDIWKSVDGSLTTCYHQKNEVVKDDVQVEEKGTEESFLQFTRAIDLGM